MFCSVCAGLTDSNQQELDALLIKSLGAAGQGSLIPFNADTGEFRRHWGQGGGSNWEEGKGGGSKGGRGRAACLQLEGALGMWGGGVLANPYLWCCPPCLASLPCPALLQARS